VGLCLAWQEGLERKQEGGETKEAEMIFQITNVCTYEKDE